MGQKTYSNMFDSDEPLTIEAINIHATYLVREMAAIREDINKLGQKLDHEYVTRERFRPVEVFQRGFIATLWTLFGVCVLGGIFTLAIKKF